MNQRRLQVQFFLRKPYASGNYSIEYLFSEIRRRLTSKVDARVVVPRFHSRGLFRRIVISLEAWLRRGPINLITGDISYVGAFLPGSATILVVLDCGLIYEKPSFKRWVEEWLWLRIPVSRASNVVTISEATKQDLLTITRCDPSKITVIPCFISSVFKRADRAFGKNKPVLLQVGQARNKNLNRIIHAISGLNVRLSIIGNVDANNIELLHRFNIDYTFFVNLTEEEVFSKYIECDMLVFPSTFEGFGMPIVEAQTVGRPVVTSSTTSMPWVAGGAACLVDPYSVESIREGVLKVINDDSYRSELVARGYENARRFDPDNVAEMYYQLFKRVAVKAEIAGS